MRKQQPSDSASAGRFTSRFWLDRVFRPTYTRDNQRQEVAEFYAQVQHAGRREKVCLASNDRQQAAMRAAAFYKRLRKDGWDAALLWLDPERTNPRSPVSVGDYLTLARPLIDRDRTFANYAYALRKIAREATGRGDKSKRRFDPVSQEWRRDADKILLAEVTPSSVKAWQADFVASAKRNPLLRQRAQRSVNSFLRNARGLFSKRILETLHEQKVQLPTVLPFDGVELEPDNRKSRRYVSTINAAVLLANARDELAETTPDAWLVILLALGAGLRKSEIDALTWRQVDFVKGQIRIETTEHFETKSEDSANSVYVDAGLLAELKKHAKPTGFVIEHDTPLRETKAIQHYRAVEAFATATQWLRANGVLTDKPIHTLRKEFGSLINASSDIYTASRQLRHADLETTASYYADNRRQVTVDIGTMLHTEPKEEKHAAS